jgi:hypothetical protein
VCVEEWWVDHCVVSGCASQVQADLLRKKQRNKQNRTQYAMPAAGRAARIGLHVAYLMASITLLDHLITMTNVRLVLLVYIVSNKMHAAFIFIPYFD